MRITVHFFATLRDRAGRAEIEVELTDAATVVELLNRLADNFPALQPALDSAIVAVNHEYAFPADVLIDGDEVAIFPPVSGGFGDYPEYFNVTTDELELDEIAAAVTHPQTGAVCIFTGTVRGITRTSGGDRETGHLVYQAYQPMAEMKMRQVAQEIHRKYPGVQGVAIVQRIGMLQVGDVTVAVACSSAHREDGVFEAARYGIDRLKEIVPVWKQEVGPDGSEWVEGHYHPTPADVSPPEVARSGTKEQFVIGCSQCNRQYPYDTRHYRCECGNPLEIVDAPAFDRTEINEKDFSIWRYRAMLTPQDVIPITLGEGWTPLITTQVDGRSVHIKLESTNPTGSFKDRGAALLVSLLKAHGVNTVHDDSSGNAGVALAAYCASVGISARLFVPETASPVKLTQIKLYGAQLEAVPGPRSAAAFASQEAADSGTSYYASHIYHPFAVLAYKSIAYELWEQLGYRAPDAVIVPLGHGSQLLGLTHGFEDLLAAGQISSLPRLIGVQAEACAPLAHRYHQTGGKPVTEQPTLAEGIKIIEPVRADSIFAAISASGGDIVTVHENAIVDGLKQLAKRGTSAEPTSAVVWPALRQVMPSLPGDAVIVLSITGSGYKTPDLANLVNDTNL